MACEVKNLYAGYGEMVVVHDVSINLTRGEKVALIGPNGAGKTTLIHTLVGLLKPIKGTVLIFGNDIRDLEPHEISDLGVSLIPEGGRIFPRLTVLENILVSVPSQGKNSFSLEEIFKVFPILKDRKDQLAGTLSGGEQRMLAIARSIARSPKLLIIDELSLGLAPKALSTIYNSVNELWETTGMSILITEQFIKRALEFSHRAYLIEQGSIVLEGQSHELLESEHVRKAYLGYAERGL